MRVVSWLDLMSRAKALQFYVITRLLLAPLMLWTITSVVFLLLRATPGDPVDAILGPRAPSAAKEALRSQLGLGGVLARTIYKLYGRSTALRFGHFYNYSRTVRLADYW